MPLSEPLPHLAPFGLLRDVQVLPHGDVPAAAVFVSRLRQGSEWSGLSLPCDGGGALVIYNDGHSLERIRATLLEEYFHLRLDHPPSIFRMLSNGETVRTYRREVERQAYESGAAALVPYGALRRMLDAGADVRTIARHFEVSSDLVIFRAKLTRQYKRLVG